MNRIGMGFDAHAFDEDRVLVLGGVTIPGHAGLAGHSDADVVSHAVADAVLGAAGLGDIGDRFPEDERWKDASSLILLREARQAVAAAGWRIVNIDVCVVAQTPRLASLRLEIEQNFAAALDVDAGSVSVKATTTDGMGFIGRSEGIGALAVALLERA